MTGGRFSLEAIFKAKDKFTRPIAKIQGRVGKMVRSMHRGFDRLRRSAAGFGAVLKRGALAAGAAAAAAGVVAKSIIGTGMSFEQAITNVAAVGLQTRNQIADLEAKAVKLGSTTKFTATEAANAMEIMARAGFKNEEILSGVDGVLSAAAASGLEMAEVADVVSNALKGMGLEASQASRVADVLALASSRTNSTIGTLGESMKNLAPVARQLGVPFEEAVASVALLQDVGLDASEAGTATATMLTKLTKPADAVAKKMKEMGVAFQDAQGDALPLQEILGNFDKASKKAGGSMEVVAFFADLVGLRGQKAALNLKDLFASGKLSSLNKELNAAAGTAEKMADIRMDTLQGDLTLLDSAVDGLKTRLFNTESGPLRNLVQRFTKFVDENGDKFVEMFENGMATVKELAGMFGGEFMSSMQPAIDAFKSMFPPTDDAESWKGILTVLAKSLGQLAAFAVMVTAAFVGIAGVLTVLVSGAVNTVLGFIDMLAKRIADRIHAVMDFFSDLGAIFDAEGLTLGDKMLKLGKRVVEGLIDGMKSMALGPINVVRDLGKSIVDGFSEAMGMQSPSKKMASRGTMTTQGLARGIMAGIPGVRGAANEMVRAVEDTASRIERTSMPAINVATRFTDGGFSSPDSDEDSGADVGAFSGRQLVKDRDAMVREIREERETFNHRLLIEDSTGRASLNKDRRSKGSGISLTTKPSGAF